MSHLYKDTRLFNLCILCRKVESSLCSICIVICRLELVKVLYYIQPLDTCKRVSCSIKEPLVTSSRIELEPDTQLDISLHAKHHKNLINPLYLRFKITL